MSKKQFTTTIDEGIQQNFREKCSINNYKMNDVLEALMDSYSKDEFLVEKKINFVVKKTN